MIHKIPKDFGTALLKNVFRQIFLLYVIANNALSTLS